MAAALALVAHQGGWDEIVLVAGPIVFIIGVLAIAKRRVDKVHRLTEDVGETTSPGPSSS